MVLRESLPFWAANGMFLLTGCIMIILNQQLGYYRANSPFSFFAGLAQYTGMLAGGLAWLSRRGGRLFPNGLHSRRVLPIAATNLAVAFFSVLGILDLGSGSAACTTSSSDFAAAERAIEKRNAYFSSCLRRAIHHRLRVRDSAGGADPLGCAEEAALRSVRILRSPEALHTCRAAIHHTEPHSWGCLQSTSGPRWLRSPWHWSVPGWLSSGGSAQISRWLA